jgi:hypothetical protein
MKFMWTLAFGLLAGTFILWLTGTPPPASFYGVRFYPQMLLSGAVVGVAVIMRLTSNNTPPPSRPV